VHGYTAGRSPSLHHATVGVVGASRIGRLVIGMLSAFDIEILVYDPYLTEQEAAQLGVRSASLDALCSTSDIITIHAPELPETAKMIGEAQLRAMHAGAVLINTARGALVDTEALTRHCTTGRIDAVLDVTEPEPLPTGHPLLHLPNVVITPHLAGAKGREVSRLGDFAVDEVERFVAGRVLLGEVTAGELARIA
jgi:phosphoglycerate dehydrogenase-like enzyme